MTLYEINSEYSGLLKEIDEAMMDNEDGVIPTDLAEKLFTLEDALDSKCENIVKAIKNIDADVKAYKEQMEYFANKKKRAENSIQYLKALMLDIMNTYSQRKVKAGVWGVSIRTSRAVKLDDESALPEEYVKITRSAKVAEIHKAIDAGQVIPGAHIEEKESLSIN